MGWLINNLNATCNGKALMILKYLSKQIFIFNKANSRKLSKGYKGNLQKGTRFRAHNF